MYKRTRRYDIGNGWIITDDGQHYTANWESADGKSSTSIGVKRPPKMPLPDLLPTIFSLDDQFFYLRDFTAGVHGFWLGTKKWNNLAEMQAQQQAGIFGKSYASFTPEGQETYYRETLPFAYWSVKSDQRPRSISKTDDRALDYLALAQNDDRDQEKRFNEAIASSGRTLAWIHKRIGDWVEFDPEPPPIPLF